MKKNLLIIIAAVFCQLPAFSQNIVLDEGKCGKNVTWSFDGYTLSITNVTKVTEFMPVAIEDYTLNDVAPWVKKKLPVRRVRIGEGISRIGSCAFANCDELLDVEFSSYGVTEIGWGAFLNCTRLRNISLPFGLQKIETIAFANCKSLSSVTIPDQCRVEDQAYLSCDGITQISISTTSVIGHYTFASEVNTKNGIRHTLCNAEIKKLPAYINTANSNRYGIAREAVEKYNGSTTADVNYDEVTSGVDTDIPESYQIKQSTYALVLGNQNYRFAPDVPYAIHDARIFADYCNKTLGIPSENIHVCEDATKQMILEDEFEWLKSIENPLDKKIIVYYAGHGVPDVADKNRAYLLPTDVRGTKPQRGIALDDLYAQLGDMSFGQVCVFLDACFSGLNRNDESVNEGLRGVEIVPQESSINEGNVVVFSAAQGNETAQGYTEQGHGLFTYCLLKEIQDTSGNITLGELSDRILSNVTRTAPQLRLRKGQTPTTNSSNSISDSWRMMHLK